MVLHKLLPLFALGLNLILLGSALSADRRSPRIRLFAYLVSALAVWNLGVLGLRWVEDAGTALVWERLLHLGVIPIPVLFYHYVLAFLDQPARRPSLVTGYVLCGVFTALSPTPAFMPGVVTTYWGFAPEAGPLYAPFFVYFQTYLLIGLACLVRAYRAAESSFRRNRTLVVICGAVVSILGGVVDFVRFIFGWEQLYPVGIPSNAVFALALGVAIVRYRLMDMGALAKRSVSYLLTSLAIAPILFAGLYLIDLLAPNHAMPTRFGTDFRYPLILLVAFAVSLPFLRKLEAGLDRLMFQRQHGVRDALVALNREMSALLDLDTLGPKLTEGLVARIPAVHASLHLCDPAAEAFVPVARAVSGAAEAPDAPALDGRAELWLRLTGRTLVIEETVFRAAADPRLRSAVEALEEARVALLVPLLLDGELTGVLALGEKLSGEVFDQREIELLETLGGHAAIAIRNARLYEDLRDQMNELRRTQEQLVQSAKLAVIGELAATVAHEISNPLMVIMTTGELLREQMPRESLAQGKLTKITTEAERAAKILRDLLDFARRREPKRELVNLRALVSRSLDLAQVKFAGRGIDVQLVFDPAAGLVLGDPDQLVQVFINLLANAADAMRSGGSLVVRTERREHAGRPAVAVAISDTGAGMGPEQQQRLFEPFYTTKSEGRGTGLGLSVSLGIVKKHGGTIEIESALGKGTTMTVRLPLAA